MPLSISRPVGFISADVGIRQQNMIEGHVSGLARGWVRVPSSAFSKQAGRTFLSPASFSFSRSLFHLIEPFSWV